MSSSRVGFVVATLLALGGAALLMWPRFRQPSPSQPQAPAPAAASATSGTAVCSSAAVGPPPSARPGTGPPHVTIHPESADLCPADMVYVAGSYCPFVAFRCASYLGTVPEPAPGYEAPDEERRCGRYHNELMCEGRPARLRFCIDRLEYPNIVGAKPVVMVDYHQAKAACRAEGKRICEADEWMLACEGPRTWPYPYGLERDPGACNIDRRPRQPNRRALSVPYDVSVEIERLDQRVPGGALSSCVSSFGAQDMTGNVAEWVHDREADGTDSSSPASLAGGHWERVPATCRRRDGSHAPQFRSYRVGFRCCRDALDGRKARRLAPSGTRLPRRRALVK